MLEILLILMLVAPTLSVLIALVSRSARIAEFVNLAASCVTLIVVLPLPYLSLQGPFYYLANYVLIDSLSAWVLLCVAIVYFLSSIYAVGYMRLHPPKHLFLFYALFAGFALAMFTAPIMNNIGVYWIMIEMTTLVSTFLVGFVQAPESIEAAWKYIIIVSAGISLALLGVILFYWGGTFIVGPSYNLTWVVLAKTAPAMNPILLLLAFLLVLIGFGTKVGLAPMHTWLPDAHSEGPSPVSAMLSGALLNTAMLGIVRFLSAVNQTSIKGTADLALIMLGVISLFIAALFIVNQQGIKRLMAYSSVEHMGVLALGFGFGGVLGMAGSLYHMLNHSLNKSLMFFGAGNAMHVYDTKDMNKMRQVLKHLPFSGGIWLAGAIAITGAPPFGLFLSEFTVLRAGLNTANHWAIFVMAILLIIIFCGFLNHFWQMYFAPVEMNSEVKQGHAKISMWCVVPMCIAIIPLLLLGLWWPDILWNFFQQISLQLGIKT